MNEVGKFVRYSLPGIASIIQLGIAILLTERGAVTSFDAPDGISAVIGIVLATFVATGGYGYLLAMIYLGLSRLKFAHRLAYVDYSRMWKAVENLISVRNESGKEIRMTSISKTQSYPLAIQYWFSRIEQSKTIKGVDLRVQKIADLKQSIGTTLVGSIIALIVWISAHFTVFDGSLSIVLVLTAVGWFGILSLLVRSFKITRDDVRILVESTIIQDLNERAIKKEDPENPIIIWFSP